MTGILPPPKADGKFGAIVQAANAEGPPGGSGLAFEFASGFGLMLFADSGGTSEDSGNWPLSDCGRLDAGEWVTCALPSPPLIGKFALVLSQSWSWKISARVVGKKLPIANGWR